MTSYPERLALDLSMCELRGGRRSSHLSKEWEGEAHSGGQSSHDHLWG